MPSRVAVATGNWSATTTWLTGDQESVSGTSSVSVTSSSPKQIPFTPSANHNCAGVVLFLANSDPPTGVTITVALQENVGGTWTDRATASVSTANLKRRSIAFFKFTTAYPVTAVAGVWRFEIRSNSASSTTFYGSSTTAPLYVEVTDTTGAPTAGEKTYICGNGTTAGTYNTVVVTVDINSTTDYGQIFIGHGGTLKFSRTVSTNLDVAGDVLVRGAGAVLDMGTATDRIPSTVTASLRFSNASDGQFGLRCEDGGEIHLNGAVRSPAWTLLAANASAGATTLTVADTTDWQPGEDIAIAPTRRAYGEHERRTLAAGTSGTTLVVSSGLTYPHQGTAPYQAEVVLLTRNVKIQSKNTAYRGYCVIAGNWTISWVEFVAMGANVGGKNAALYFDGGAGSGTLTGISAHDGYRDILTTSGYGASLTCQDCVAYNNATGPSLNAASGGSVTLQNHVVTRLSLTTTNGIEHVGGNVTLSGCRVSGSGGRGFTSGGVVQNCVSHSNGGSGFYVTTGQAQYTGCRAWRNNNHGFYITGPAYGSVLDNIEAFENSPASTASNIYLDAPAARVTLKNIKAYGSASYPSYYGLYVEQAAELRVIGAELGVAGAHQTADLRTASGAVRIYGYDIRFGSATTVSVYQPMRDWAVVGLEKINGDNQAHRAWLRQGTVEADYTVYRTGPPAARLSPLSGTEDLVLTWQIPCSASGLVNVSLYVKKSATGWASNPVISLLNPDGTVAAQVAVTEDVTTWVEKTLSATPTHTGVLLLEVKVRDGTGKYINIDDISVTYG